MSSPTVQYKSPSRSRASPAGSPAPTPGPSKPRSKAIAIELSSGSDNDEDRAARLAQAEQARKTKIIADRNRVRAAIPDVDARVILEMFQDPQYGGDPDLIALAILESNYPLRDGGWKWGNDPEVGPGGNGDANGCGSGGGRDNKQKKRRAENDSDADSDKDQDRRAPRPDPREKKQKQARRTASSDEEEQAGGEADDEVDQLASDDEQAAGSEEEEESEDEATYEDVMDQEGYWLDVVTRDAPEDSYRKAALNQLFREYNKYAENYIRSRFESDECDYYYAPTWLDLRRMQKDGTLLKLKGPPRDMDAPIILNDGTKRARKPVEKSKTLQKEMRWLGKYLHFGGRGLKQKKDPKKSPAKKRKNESLAARRARLSGGQPAEKKQKKGKKKVATESEDDEEMARSSDDNLTPIASTSAAKAHSAKAKAKGKSKANPVEQRRVRFEADEDEGECWEDLYGHRANTDGWGPGYQDKPSTSSSKGKKKKDSSAAGSWAASKSGPIRVKEEEREWFMGDGRRLGD
ncbi:hypothetical protein JCM10908_005372 [Rhodotorula pacifica]|uniref:uncharacterized protein n=1 Tax=Rhodotorula pacifica TaxID=1495444 RepID=UPI00317B9CAC